MSARTSGPCPRAGSVGSIALLALTLGCEIDLERMLDQHKAEPFEASPFFADGQAMRAPPAGTVPATRLTGPVELRSGRSANGEYVRTLPVPLDAALLERGQDRFRIFCRTCHGALGDGQSPVAENMKLRRPPSLHEQRIRDFPPGRIFRVVTDGYGLMPSHADALDVRDRWAVVAFVRALQLSQSVPLAELPQTLKMEAAPWL